MTSPRPIGLPIIPDGVSFAVAIDGPAGAGKSALGAALSAATGATYIDSGIAYRAVTWDALESGIDLDDDAVLAPRAAALPLAIKPPCDLDGRQLDGRQFTATLDGQDVTWALRSPEVDAAVSRPSALPGVRAAVTDQLRRLAATGRVVMVGRDIGTVVLPNADLKLWVTATSTTRADRRVTELHARGVAADRDAIHAGIVDRDERDSTRATAPSRAATDAIVIETDTMTIGEEVATAIVALAARLAQPGRGGSP
jgi:cytidylate kinase